MTRLCGVHQHQFILLLTAAMVMAMDASHNLASERSSIESTYELTKYLEYQLKEIKDVYLTYLGPPFNEKDFSPPRPNSTSLSLPIAATRLELWHGLENQARLAQNQKAYSVLLAAVRELARSTLCPSLKTSLLHFCTGLDGLLGSISALMTTLGYTLPPPSANMRSSAGELQYPLSSLGGDQPAPLMSQSLYRSRAGTRMEVGHRNNHKRGGMRVVKGDREDGVNMDLIGKKRAKEGRRAETTAARGRSGGSREKGRGDRGRRGKREEPESRIWAASEDERVGEEGQEELERERGVERWGRRLLSISEDGEEEGRQTEPGVELSYLETQRSDFILPPTINDNNNRYSYNLNSRHIDTIRKEDGFIVVKTRGLMLEEGQQTNMEAASSSSAFYHQRRPPRSLFSSTLQPPLATLSLLYQFGAGEKHTLLPQPVPLSLQRGTSLLSPPLTPLLSSSSSSSSSSLLSVRPTMNDFARKVEGFWILRELQSWLWRSAKDFNRLKKRLRG
nr:PREDICTED: cardiotrophin-like cytokine factor 1 [Paralichthys olivaceus]